MVRKLGLSDPIGQEITNKFTAEISNLTALRDKADSKDKSRITTAIARTKNQMKLEIKRIKNSTILKRISLFFLME